MPIRGIYYRPPLISLLLVILATIFCSASAYGLESGVSVQPSENSVFTGRKPAIEADFGGDVDINSIIILLDGMDITPASKLTPEGVSYSSPVPVSGGEHSVEIQGAYTDGNPLLITWSFSVRHSERFDELGFSADLTVAYTNNFRTREDSSPIPGYIVEAGGPVNFHVRKGGKEFSLGGSAYYLQEDETLQPQTADKGADFRNFLITGRWAGDKSVTSLSTGDIGITESNFTAPYLYRRGISFNKDFSRTSLALYSVNSTPVTGVRNGLKIGLDSDNNIIGTSIRTASKDDRTRLHATYLTGREDAAGSYGVSTLDGVSEGDVLGLVVDRSLLPDKLNIRLEGAASSFDPDISDQDVESKDWAFFTGVVWVPTQRLKLEASVEHVGADFRSIGSPGATSDIETVNLTGDFLFTKHMFNLTTGYSRSNLENDTAIPVSSQWLLEATDRYTVRDNLSLEFHLHTDLVDTSDEPAGYDPYNTRTNTLSTLLSYSLPKWSMATFLLLSGTDDTTASDLDTTHDEFRLDLSIVPSSRFSASLTLPQIIRERDVKNDIDFNTYNAAVLLNASLVTDILSLDLAGSYSRSDATDDSVDQRSSNASTRLAYSLARHFPEYASPNIALGGEYSRTEDTIWASDLTQYRIFITLELHSNLNY